MVELDHDATFRLILVLGFALVFPFGLYYRIRSQATGERLDRRQEGWFILLTLRPVALIAMAGVVTLVIDPSWMAWSRVELAPGLRWAGVGFGGAAGLLLIWVFHSLGPNLTDTVVTRQNHTLVTRGPYRFVRHPLYLAAGLAVTAAALMTASWFPALTGLLVLTLIVVRTDREEANLIRRFGDDYRRYMRTTGRFLPRLRSR